MSIARAVFVQLIREVNGVKQKQLTPSGFLSALKVVMTAPKRGKMDKKLRTDINDFWKRLVQNAIDLARDNSLLLFRDGIPPVPKKEDEREKQHEGEDGDAAQPIEGEHNDCKDEEEVVQKTQTEEIEEAQSGDDVVVVADDPRDVRPWWIMHVNKDDEKSGTYITEKHLTDVHEFDLGLTKRKMYADRTEIGRKQRKPGRDDFAFFACKEGFTKFTNVLNDNRKFASKSFFRDIGYFFEDWTIPQQEYGIDKTTLTLTLKSHFPMITS